MRVFVERARVCNGDAEVIVPPIAGEPIRLKVDTPAGGPVSVYLSLTECRAIAAVLAQNPDTRITEYEVGQQGEILPVREAAGQPRRVHAVRMRDRRTTGDILHEARELFRLARLTRMVEDPQWA